MVRLQNGGVRLNPSPLSSNTIIQPDGSYGMSYWAYWVYFLGGGKSAGSGNSIELEPVRLQPYLLYESNR